MFGEVKQKIADAVDSDILTKEDVENLNLAAECAMTKKGKSINDASTQLYNWRRNLWVTARLGGAARNICAT